MASTTIYIGDTITVHAEFRDADASLIDADGNTVTFKVYNNENLAVVATQTATRLSQGVYEYKWLVPGTGENDEKVYVLEMEGDFSAKPQLKRIKAKARFRP